MKTKILAGIFGTCFIAGLVAGIIGEVRKNNRNTDKEDTKNVDKPLTGNSVPEPYRCRLMRRYSNIKEGDVFADDFYESLRETAGKYDIRMIKALILGVSGEKEFLAYPGLNPEMPGWEDIARKAYRAIRYDYWEFKNALFDGKFDDILEKQNKKQRLTEEEKAHTIEVLKKAIVLMNEDFLGYMDDDQIIECIGCTKKMYQFVKKEVDYLR